MQMARALVRLVRSVPFAAALVVSAAVALAAPAPSLAGRIVKVDVDGRSLTVRSEAGAETALVVDDKSVIVLDGDAQAILEDLFEGDDLLSAAVRRAEDGRLVVVKAVVTSKPSPDDDDGAIPGGAR
ncbi:MAG TPA: hypothetical protein PKG80_06670 [Acidobacteriota bacterium]|nr:hypothetical protein [bacterium]HNX19939.1 hypothetical protein [Acidobacteriota bacterium]